jgi:hypothetical protein
MAKIDQAGILAIAQYEGDKSHIVETIVEILRSDAPEQKALLAIADLFNEVGKAGEYRLELKRRRGNKAQHDDLYFEYLSNFQDILNKSATEKEAVKTASMSCDEGGLGVSEVTAYKYLKVIKDAKPD